MANSDLFFACFSAAVAFPETASESGLGAWVSEPIVISFRQLVPLHPSSIVLREHARTATGPGPPRATMMRTRWRTDGWRMDGG
ncbi:hypothetical protein M430DRAFT_184880 [Amorphotheca resinae ATCC 22711]|uniref:Uncharacterized protein n=1 Tax=Amorphotheca resinae ATCC 22711 TaxID=857342 RepID=A0A2T3ASF3_AMORE|nr:hypothetical protein M430DRAFT_184880 [Amorphotheca resinae ATCC 22711]PSS09262.1 hypothetical protein M430DRAFT_184880 [Amorphotheca resinae ATCC 22711]